MLTVLRAPRAVLSGRRFTPVSAALSAGALALGIGLGMAPGASAQAADLTCDAPEAPLAKALCADDGLRALAGMAPDDAVADEAAKACLQLTEDAERTACLRRSLLISVAEARLTGAPAPGGEDAPQVFGPFSPECPPETQAPEMSLVFINVDAPSSNWLAIQGGQGWVVLAQAISASGARYVDAISPDALEVWNTGDEATFTPGGAEPMTCKLAPS